MNPVELGQGTFPLSEAATDRFAAMVQIGYLPPEEEEKLVDFDFKRMTPAAAAVQAAHHRAAGGDRRARVPAPEPRPLRAAPGRRDAAAAIPRPTGGTARRRSWSSAAWIWGPRRARSSAGAGWPRPGRCCRAAAPRCIPRTSRRWRRSCSATASGSGRTRPRMASRPIRSSPTSSRGADPMTHAPAATALVDLNEIAKIELLVLRRLAGGATGEHRSRADGAGFDFVGLRDWQAGDRFSAIDWPQSSLTNFAPLVVREFDQPSTATVLAVADVSLSTRCGAGGTPLGGGRRPARWPRSACRRRSSRIASACSTFDRGFAAVGGRGRRAPAAATSSTASRPTRRAAGWSRWPAAAASAPRWPAACGRPSLVPVISDFLFDDALDVDRASWRCVNVDARRLPRAGRQRLRVCQRRVSSGWITVHDVEGGDAARAVAPGLPRPGRPRARLAGTGGARRPRRRPRRRRAGRRRARTASWRWPSSWPSGGLRKVTR